MSDADVGASAEPTEAPADIPTSAGATDSTVPPEHSVLDNDLPEGMQQFSREHMENTRKEAARHRVAAREANERIAEMETRYGAFDQFEDQDKETWLGLMNSWAADPTQAANDFRQIANNVLGDPTATQEEKVEAVQMAEQAEAGLTPEAVKSMMTETLDQRDAAATQAAAIEKVHAEIAEAGFEKGTADNFKVLWIANNDPEVKGDVAAAIEKVKAEKQTIIDNYVAGVRDGGTPTPAPTGVAGTDAPPPITSMDEAAKGAKEFLRNRERA